MLRALLLTIFLSVSVTLPALADCTSPAGAESQTRYDFSTHKLYYCNGTSWIETGGTAGGSGGGGAPLIPGVPDVIRCSGSGGTLLLDLTSTYSDGKHYYAPRGAYSQNTYIVYNPNGSYQTYNDTGNWYNWMSNCITNAWSFSQLYAQGRAYNSLVSQTPP